MSIETQARAWLAEDPDPTTRAELEALIAAGGEPLATRFSGRLQFGTAGIRGVLGAGPMCMNRVVVQRVTAGLADYLIETVDGARERGVVIAFDGRHNSDVFSRDTARVFQGKGFKVWLGTQVLPTPIAAFAVGDRGAAAGVMVTASHNPPEYNGYKVYWQNGAQIISPHDEGISAAIDRVGRVDALSMPELAAEPLGEDVVRRYLDGVRALAAHPDASAKARITIAYTPLHGVGAVFAERALAEAGFDAVHTEPSQREPDGDFPTVRFPNPEEDGAMDAVLALADKVDADVVFANDPDADRLAVALPDEDGDARYSLLSGDQIGVLLADYLLSEGGPSGDRMVATTIVSSQLLGKMAADRGVDYRETLTGFKWIANAAIDYAAQGGRFVVGYEEALGYSVGELVRDKDGVSAIVTFAEMVAFDGSQGRTVRQRLDSIYRRFGLYLTEQHSLVLPGADGLARIKSTMERFRAEPPERIGDHAVLRRHDILQGDLGLPKSNVLVFHLDGDRRVIMRPSGTEPKLKAYYEVCEPVGEGESVDAAVARAEVELEALRAAHQAMLA